MVEHAIKEGVTVAGAVFTAVAMRWLLGIATPESDIRAVSRFFSQVMFEYKRLRWYRGTEYMYQLKARKIYLT